MNEKLNLFFGGAFHKIIFLIALLVSAGLIITSFFIPPLSVIDGSVLAGVGELFAFAALGEVAAAIERGHGAKIEHNGTSITVGDLNKDEGQEA